MNLIKYSNLFKKKINTYVIINMKKIIYEYIIFLLSLKKKLTKYYLLLDYSPRTHNFLLYFIIKINNKFIFKTCENMYGIFKFNSLINLLY